MRDELLGQPPDADFDLVTTGSSADLAYLLREAGIAEHDPVTYPRFGTAMIQVLGTSVEIVTARRESYDSASRKPSTEPATLVEDALRRDFTINTLMRALATQDLVDPLGTGLQDLRAGILRTPRDPMETFQDDPLRMLRAVRFCRKLGFEPFDGLYPAIREAAPRLAIVSHERIRDEVLKMLLLPDADKALGDLMDLGLWDVAVPEFRAMVGCEQGSFHHLDVWEHSLLVVRNAGPGDVTLSLAALLHDVGKPATRFVDERGATRFFGHETVGADLARSILRRWNLANREVDDVVSLVKNHMRLGSAPTFSPAAARRLVADLGPLVPKLLALVEADAASLRPGVRTLDLEPIRAQIRSVSRLTPRETLKSPLNGEEIMSAMGWSSGPRVGQAMRKLQEMVIEGTLDPDDSEGALQALRRMEA